MLDGENRIIQNAVKGESSAFGLLYDHYQPMIYRFVYLKTSRREDAEDLTHQVFLQAWQSIRTYKDFGHPFSSWLYRIARNEVIDHYRTKKPSVAIEDVDPEYFSAIDDAFEAVERNLDIHRVVTVLKTLKPEYQDVIIMRFIEELSPKEVAAALKKSEGAVKLIQHRALKQLQQRVSRA
jgi:RNA polymerase sigma-70 factor (ECF subfamily)